MCVHEADRLYFAGSRHDWAVRVLAVGDATLAVALSVIRTKCAAMTPLRRARPC
jgi:hypothetical protein